MCSVHVVCCSEQCAIESDFGIGIDSFEYQFQFRGMAQYTVRFQVKNAPVNPILIRYPLQAFFICSVEWVIDLAVSKQIRDCISRNLCRKPSTSAFLLKFPSIIQWNNIADFRICGWRGHITSSARKNRHEPKPMAG